jgi:SAM-dependent methyltransferase/uncharacterized protein YbaR (Trm112 family)
VAAITVPAMRLSAEQLQRVRCPCSLKSGLERVGSELVCRGAACAKRFPIIDGTPVLINDDTSVSSIGDFVNEAAETQPASHSDQAQSASSTFRTSYRRLAYSLTEFSVNLNYRSSAECIRRLGAEKAKASCLIVGCGRASYDAPANVEVVYSDIARGPLVQLIADAHDLPFADRSFDMVVAAAVLQHVADPQKCVSEFWRVLKDDGIVYAVSAFMQPVHGGAHDFTRFTHLGHVRLFRWFDEIESGMALGPGAALGWSMQRFVLGFSDNLTVRKALRLFGLVVTLPLKFADLFFRHRKGALDGAGGTFFWGRKRSSPISDREMIGKYRGLDSRAG